MFFHVQRSNFTDVMPFFAVRLSSTIYLHSLSNIDLWLGTCPIFVCNRYNAFKGLGNLSVYIALLNFRALLRLLRYTVATLRFSLSVKTGFLQIYSVYTANLRSVQCENAKGIKKMMMGQVHISPNQPDAVSSSALYRLFAALAPSFILPSFSHLS